MPDAVDAIVLPFMGGTFFLLLRKPLETTQDDELSSFILELKNTVLACMISLRSVSLLVSFMSGGSGEWHSLAATTAAPSHMSRTV